MLLAPLYCLVFLFIAFSHQWQRRRAVVGLGRWWIISSVTRAAVKLPSSVLALMMLSLQRATRHLQAPRFTFVYGPIPQRALAYLKAFWPTQKPLKRGPVASQTLQREVKVSKSRSCLPYSLHLHIVTTCTLTLRTSMEMIAVQIAIAKLYCKSRNTRVGCEGSSQRSTSSSQELFRGQRTKTRRTLMKPDNSSTSLVVGSNYFCFCLVRWVTRGDITRRCKLRSSCGILWVGSSFQVFCWYREPL